MTRPVAVTVIHKYAFNFAIGKAKSAVEDAIDARSYDKLGWWEMQEVWRNVAKEIAELDGFYFWSVSGIDQDEFVAAKWAMGEDFVKATCIGYLNSFTADTVEMLGQSKLERKQKEAQRENVDG